MKIRSSRGLSMPNVINKGARYGSALGSGTGHNMSMNDGLNTSTASPKANNKISLKKSAQSAPEHIFKTLQIGKVTKKSKLFNDRSKIGKNEAKIVAIDFYEQNIGNNDDETTLIGFQASYQIQKSIRKG